MYIFVLQDTVNSCYEFGCFFDTISIICFGQCTSRKPLLVTGGVLMVIGTLLSTVSYGHSRDFGQFVIGCDISGIGNNLDTTTIPVW